MTAIEAKRLLEYAVSLYPSAKMTDAQFNKAVTIWAAEFQSETCERVMDAFKLARYESPDWMPSVPKIQAALRTLETQARPKSEDEEFRDGHAGKSQSEWEAYNDWASSKSGKAKIEQYKKRLKQLTGV